MRTAKKVPTKAKPDRRPDDPAQSRRFLEAAKAAGADETEEGARQAFRRVVSPAKPSKR